MIKGKKFKLGIILLLFAVYMSWVFYKKNQLENHFKITAGTVIGITDVFRSDKWGVLYEYEVNGQKFSAESIYSFCGNLTFSSLRQSLTSRHFPVAFSEDDAGTSRIIITNRDAETFQYEVPDSLQRYDSLLNCK